MRRISRSLSLVRQSQQHYTVSLATGQVSPPQEPSYLSGLCQPIVTMGSPKGSSGYGQYRRRIARDAPPEPSDVVDER